MDPLLAQLLGSDSSNDDSSTADSANDGIPQPEQITVIAVNYFENGREKETWMKADKAVNLQFFTETERFTPHYNLAAITCTAQCHEPFWWQGYIADYAVESKGSRPVPSAEQLAFYKRLAIETANEFPDAKLGQIYDNESGTAYHWGAAVRLRESKYGEIMLDLFLDSKLFTTIRANEPNMDKNERTKNVKFRGRFDPNRLWKPKARKKS